MISSLMTPCLTRVYRTRLYREYKLCCLLLRPLDDVSGDWAPLRGYSRQMTTTNNSRCPLSCSSSSSLGDCDDDEDGHDDRHGRDSTRIFSSAQGPFVFALFDGK